MKIKAAVVDQAGDNWDVRDIELLEHEIRPDEVLVEMQAAGLCHTDEHIREGELPARFPFVGGHEGSAIAVAVGSEVKDIEAGDHVVLTFRPSCGLCHFCSEGRPNLCIKIRNVQQGDEQPRFLESDQRLNAQSLLGTFAEFSVVPATSCVVVPKDIPFDVAALLGCAIPTGYGAAVHAAQTKTGDHCIVIGAGGVGMNAVQGAKVAGAASVVVVDLSAEKQRIALDYGADAAVDSLKQAQAYVEVTHGVQHADVVILTVPVSQLAHEALDVLKPGGRLVLAALGEPSRFRLDLPINRIVMNEITLRGTVMGSAALRRDIPRILALYRQGKFKLDELITHRFALQDIRQGYATLHSGDMVRGVIDHSLDRQSGSAHRQPAAVGFEG